MAEDLERTDCVGPSKWVFELFGFSKVLCARNDTGIKIPKSSSCSVLLRSSCWSWLYFLHQGVITVITGNI